MKKLLAILFGAMFVLVSVGVVLAGQSKIIDKRNEYGGETEEETYSLVDGKYKEGLEKLTEYYDGNKRIMKLESVFTNDHARLDGVQRSIQYYDNKPLRIGVRTRVEFYYTDAYAGREGVAKAFQYYDEDGEKTKIEYFYTDDYAKRRQVSRLEVQYSEKGKVIKRIYYDKNGMVLSSEDKTK